MASQHAPPDNNGDPAPVGKNVIGGWLQTVERLFAHHQALEPPPSRASAPQPSRSDDARATTEDAARAKILGGLDATLRERCKANHMYQHDEIEGAVSSAPHTATRLTVVDQDVLQAAIDVLLPTTLAPTGHPTTTPPLVLSLANATKPGGGWRTGHLAQEEQLWYRTTLPEAFLDYDGASPTKEYSLLHSHAHYAPDVVITRSSEYDDLRLGLSRQVADKLLISVVSVAAIDLRARGDSARTLSAADVEYTKKQLRLCLRVARKGGHRVLLLGALGCGVFANPPAHVAQLWLEVLREAEFCGRYWDRIIFAVLGGARDTGRVNTFDVFRGVLDGQVVGIPP